MEGKQRKKKRIHFLGKKTEREGKGKKRQLKATNVNSDTHRCSGRCRLGQFNHGFHDCRLIQSI